MTDAYQEDTYQEEYEYEPAPKKGMSGWLIALIVVLVLLVICCACLCLGMLLLGPAVGDTFSTIIESMTPLP